MRKSRQTVSIRGWKSLRSSRFAIPLEALDESIRAQRYQTIAARKSANWSERGCRRGPVDAGNGGGGTAVVRMAGACKLITLFWIGVYGKCWEGKHKPRSRNA
jgi:hypothetical protein